jgi:hypothetical protein
LEATAQNLDEDSGSHVNGVENACNMIRPELLQEFAYTILPPHLPSDFGRDLYQRLCMFIK